MPERASLVTGLIIERPLCMDCITAKGQLTVADVHTAFASIRKVLDLRHAEQGRCRACRTVGLVYWIHRPKLA
jgi:hypothetical protein